MFKKIINIFFFISFSIFIILSMFYYFSDKNINSINKSRATYSPETSNFYNNLPILENDTKNIIVYTDDVEIFRNKKKKYNFWELIEKKNDGS